MKHGLLIICSWLLFISVCYAQTDTTKHEFYFKQFNWHVTIPREFRSLTQEELIKVQETGRVAMEKTTNQTIVNNSTPIFSFKSDQLHFFMSNYQPFDTAVDGDYNSVCKQVDDIVYNTLSQQLPQGTRIDSTLTTETIGKLTFRCIKLIATLPNKVKINLLMYNRLFDKVELTVSIMYVDEDKGTQLLNAWRNSKFD